MEKLHSIISTGQVETGRVLIQNDYRELSIFLIIDAVEKVP